jgi:putative ABC transport system permease protein
MGTIKRGALNALRNPIRLVIVVLLLGVCLTFVAVMVALNASVQDRLTQIRGQVGTGITIRPSGSFGPFGGSGSSTTLSDAQVSQVANTPGIVSVEPSITQFYTGTEVKSPAPTSQGGRGFGGFRGNGGNQQTGPIVYGVSNGLSSANFFAGGTATLVSGRDFASSDANGNVAMMSQAMAQTNNLKIGSNFTLKGTTLQLIGLYKTGSDFSDNSILLPIKTAERLFSLSGVNSVTAYASSVNQVNSVASKLRSELGSSFDVVTQEDIINNTASALDSTQNTIKAAFIASVAVATLLIIFAVFLIVRERSQEIGVLKAIGASNWRVVSQFAVEVLTVSVLAAVVAAALLLILGQPIARAFSLVSSGSGGRPGVGSGGQFIRFAGGAGGFGGFSNPLTTSLTPESLLILLALGVALAVLASVIPAWYVARLKPAQVLRQTA